MSAPDVERLARELFIEIWRMQPHFNGMDDEIREAIRLKIAEAALSSHPDPLPASADIAGRLESLTRENERLRIERNEFRDDRNRAYSELSLVNRNLAHADAKICELQDVIRANPSGWIPVGERLPECDCISGFTGRTDLESKVNLWPKSQLKLIAHSGEFCAFKFCPKCGQPLPTPPQEGQKL